MINIFKIKKTVRKMTIVIDKYANSISQTNI